MMSKNNKPQNLKELYLLIAGIPLLLVIGVVGTLLLSNYDESGMFATMYIIFMFGVFVTLVSLAVTEYKTVQKTKPATVKISLLSRILLTLGIVVAAIIVLDILFLIGQVLVIAITGGP